jgi:uncharacterized membrane protein
VNSEKDMLKSARYATVKHNNVPLIKTYVDLLKRKSDVSGELSLHHDFNPSAAVMLYTDDLLLHVLKGQHWVGKSGHMRIVIGFVSYFLIKIGYGHHKKPLMRIHTPAFQLTNASPAI